MIYVPDKFRTFPDIPGHCRTFACVHFFFCVIFVKHDGHIYANVRTCPDMSGNVRKCPELLRNFSGTSPEHITPVTSLGPGFPTPRAPGAPSSAPPSAGLPPSARRVRAPENFPTLRSSLSEIHVPGSS